MSWQGKLPPKEGLLKRALLKPLEPKRLLEEPLQSKLRKRVSLKEEPPKRVPGELQEKQRRRLSLMLPMHWSQERS